MSTQPAWRELSAVQTETLIGYPGSPAALERAKELGVNSIAINVGWDRVEPQEGQWDFAHVEERAAEVVQHGLLWAPAMVFTSNAPAWFEQKGLSLKQRCVEHGHENGPQSIWNPNLRPYLRKYFAAFAEHFLRGHKLGSSMYEIELFACQYGEPNFFFMDRTGAPVPGWGGALHEGFQCGDDKARRTSATGCRSATPASTPSTAPWGTKLTSFDQVEFEVPPEEAPIRRTTSPRNSTTRPTPFASTATWPSGSSWGAAGPTRWAGIAWR